MGDVIGFGKKVYGYGLLASNPNVYLFFEAGGKNNTVFGDNCLIGKNVVRIVEAQQRDGSGRIIMGHQVLNDPFLTRDSQHFLPLQAFCSYGEMTQDSDSRNFIKIYEDHLMTLRANQSGLVLGVQKPVLKPV